jgi:transcriptional repressor NrdR
MFCPKCAGKTRVIGSVDGLVRRRFRKCLKCGHTFPTVEAVQFDAFWDDYLKDVYEADKKSFKKENKSERDREN